MKIEKMPAHGCFCCIVEVPVVFLAGHKTSIMVDKQVLNFKKDDNFIKDFTTTKLDALAHKYIQLAVVTF